MAPDRPPARCPPGSHVHWLGATERSEDRWCPRTTSKDRIIVPRINLRRTNRLMDRVNSDDSSVFDAVSGYRDAQSRRGGCGADPHPREQPSDVRSRSSGRQTPQVRPESPDCCEWTHTTG